MATLKVEYGDSHVRWYTGVRRIGVMDHWPVPDPHNPLRDRDGEEREIIGVQVDWFDEDQRDAVLLNLEVGEGTQYSNDEVYVLVPLGHAWLMGDDGKTIDRVP